MIGSGVECVDDPHVALRVHAGGEYDLAEQARVDVVRAGEGYQHPAGI